MPNRKSPFVSTSTKDIITFLDDVRIALGFSQRQIDTMILLLMKADGANLHFHVGNIGVSFDSFTSEDSDLKEITVEKHIRQKNYSNTISYKIPQVYINSVMKKSSFVEST